MNQSQDLSRDQDSSILSEGKKFSFVPMKGSGQGSKPPLGHQIMGPNNQPSSTKANPGPATSGVVTKIIPASEKQRRTGSARPLGDKSSESFKTGTVRKIGQS